MNSPSACGPILIGFPGTTLDAQTRQQLLHPAVGGVVLFDRNFAEKLQLTELVNELHCVRNPRLLVCIDQEGGRVQRLRDGFTRLPPLGVLGQIAAGEPDKALDLAYRHARVMAAEMLAVGIDVSFAPVLDLDRGSSVIGDRSFSSSVSQVITLGGTYLAGMHDAGMKTTGKHFPGHGSIQADSHTDDVIDRRSMAQLEASDLLPFMELATALDAVMVAHVVYPLVDSLPAGYSSTWLSDFLRTALGYRGVIMSDDLGMHAAHVVGDLEQRTRLCLQAGCDLVLVCRPEDVEELLGGLNEPLADATPAIAALYGTPQLSQSELNQAATAGVGEWRQWQESLAALAADESSLGV